MAACMHASIFFFYILLYCTGNPLFTSNNATSNDCNLVNCIQYFSTLCNDFQLIFLMSYKKINKCNNAHFLGEKKICKFWQKFQFRCNPDLMDLIFLLPCISVPVYCSRIQSQSKCSLVQYSTVPV